MARAVIPGERIRITLARDEHLPEGERPALIYGAHNCRQWREVAGIKDSLQESKSGPESIDKMMNAVRVGLVGWEGMHDPSTGEAIPFDANNIDLILTLPDANELLVKVLQMGRVTPEERKNSDSQP